MTLRQMREKKGWTQSQLAALTHLDQTTISKLESGRVSDPVHSTLKTLARVYECSIVDIESAVRETVLAVA